MTMYDKMTDCTTDLFKNLDSMQKETQRLKAEAERINWVHTCLVNRITDDKLIDEKAVVEAINLLKTTSMSVEEIIEELKKRNLIK